MSLAIRLRRSVVVVGAAALTAVMGWSGSASAQNLRLVANWGKGIYSTDYMIKWIESFNASNGAKSAKIQITFVGGPEATPATEQLTALRNGVFDMMFGAAGYYVGAVPEGFVFYGTQLTPMAARKNGGLDLLAQIWTKKANAHPLGWVAAGVGYHIWLVNEPKLKADGTPDLAGLKIRSSGLYKPWLDSMGATNVMIPAPDIYGALERKIVDGAAWPGLGITDLGFEKFVHYRIDPPVWQFDNMLWINANKWKSLSKAAQDALNASVMKLEEDAYNYYASLVAAERAKTDKAGVKSFMLKGEAAKKYVSMAEALQWGQIKSKAPENYEALRAKFAASK
nr:TRAP transporter substrate-binding protein DctP [Nitrosomonas nitrosa]